MLFFEGVIDQPVTVLRFVLGAGRRSGGGVAAGRRKLIACPDDQVQAGRWVCRRAVPGAVRAVLRPVDVGLVPAGVPLRARPPARRRRPEVSDQPGQGDAAAARRRADHLCGCGLAAAPGLWQSQAGSGVRAHQGRWVLGVAAGAVAAGRDPVSTCWPRRCRHRAAAWRVRRLGPRRRVTGHWSPRRWP